MSSTKTFLKNYFATVHSVTTQPHKFYQDMPVSGSLKESLNFAFMTILMVSVLSAVIIIISAPILAVDESWLSFIMEMAPLFLYAYSIILMFIILKIIIYHIMLKIFGATGGLDATLKVFCYFLPISFVVPPTFYILILFSTLLDQVGLGFIVAILLPISLLFIVMLPVAYSIKVRFVGLSEVHHIPLTRVVLVLVSIPIFLPLLLIAVDVVPDLIPEQYDLVEPPFTSTGEPQPYIPTEPFTIGVPYGQFPVIDGHRAGDHNWEQQEENFSIEDVTYNLSTIHDRENLYILLMWDGGPTWNNSMDLRFEQDGDFHDHNLATGRTDYKYNGAIMDGPSTFNDGRFMGGTNETQNGTVVGHYNDGIWVQEWVVPLKGTDPGDINVEHFPTTLGFVVFDWGSGVTTGIWPPGADPYEPDTWGNLELL